MTADDHPPEPPCGDPKHPCPPPPDLAPPSLYPPSPPLPSYSATSHGRSTALIIAGAVVAFLAVCLSVFVFLRRRRQRRRQREALLEAALAPAAPPPAADDGAAGPGEEEVHHAWHIRTVGLDEAAIESIALTRYSAGAPGASDDCTVCLGEFRDGELLRLLPKCAHAFHVQCIDTWLRAHISCPLCRANVMDPAAAAAAEQPDPTPPAAGAGAEQERDAGDIGAPEHEPPGQHAHADGQRVLQIDQHHQPNISSEQPPGPRGRNFRRVASMDSPCLMAPGEEDPEQERAGGAEKHGEGGAVCCEVSPGSDDHLNRAAMERSLSAGSRWAMLSRHCRARGSLLPL